MEGFMLITAERNRIFAVTNKNRIIASFFVVIIVSQLITGICLTIYTAKGGGESDQVPPMILTYNVSAQPVPQAPLPVYIICVFVQHISVEIGLATMALVYGTVLLLPFISETLTLAIPQTFWPSHSSFIL
jgi:hypothetical protein